MTELLKIEPATIEQNSPLFGYSLEKYHAGWCVKNPKGEYLWFGSDDGEEDNFFFSNSARTTKKSEYSDTKTCFSMTLAGAMSDLKAWMKQELDENISIPPMEIYKFK